MEHFFFLPPLPEQKRASGLRNLGVLRDRKKKKEKRKERKDERSNLFRSEFPLVFFSYLSLSQPAEPLPLVWQQPGLEARWVVGVRQLLLVVLQEVEELFQNLLGHLDGDLLALLGLEERLLGGCHCLHLLW